MPVKGGDLNSIKEVVLVVPVVVAKPTGIHEVVCSIPGPAQLVKNPALL